MPTRMMVLGAIGTGKSNFILNLMKKFPNSVLFDTINQYTKIKSDRIIQNTTGHNPSDLDALCKKIWDKGNTNFILDESWFFIHPQKIDSVNFEKLWISGRNRGIGVVVVSHSLSFVNNKIIRGLAQHIIIFPVSDPLDKELLEKWWLIPDPEQSLRDYEYFHYQIGRTNYLHRHNPEPLLTDKVKL